MNIEKHIRTKNSKGETTVSIEILPPRNGENIENIFDIIDAVKNINLDFISITHGAGGSLRGGTEAIGAVIKEKFKIEPLIHLTCLEQSKEMLENNLMILKYLGLTNILALRGDPPSGENSFTPHKEGYKYSLALMEQIKNLNNGKYLLRSNDKERFNIPENEEFRPGEKSNFNIFGACYPEIHPDGNSLDFEIEYTLKKIRAGAKVLVTQMIFCAECYAEFNKAILSKEPDALIIPGVMPIAKASMASFFEKRFRVKIPDTYKTALAGLEKSDSDAIGYYELSAKLCKELVKAGAPGVHIYSMNNSSAVMNICKFLDRKKNWKLK